MAYTERVEHLLEIVPPFHIIQCRKTTIVEKDGVEIGRSHHRHTRSPGEDVSGDCSELQAVASALWNDEIIEAYQKQQEEAMSEVSPKE